MKTIVVYRSKKGYTESYAKEIGKQLDADVYELGQLSTLMLKNYDMIIFGGGIYSDKINGIDDFINLTGKALDKRILIFGVGMSPVFNEYIEKLYKINIEKKFSQDAKFFFFRGGVHMDRLTTIERKVLLAFLKVTEIFQESYTDVTTNSKPSDDVLDFSTPEYADALIQYVQGNG